MTTAESLHINVCAYTLTHAQTDAFEMGRLARRGDKN